MPKGEHLEKKWITVDEAAAYLRFHPVAVRRMIKRGDIPATVVGKRTIRVDKIALLQQLRERSNQKR
jgi:excisionase family DNA binding protein